MSDSNHKTGPFTLSRMIRTKPEQVFKVLTNSGLWKDWWGPKNFTNTHYGFEIIPGGNLYLNMIAPDGSVFPVGGEFIDIQQNHVMSFVCRFYEDEKGKTILEVLHKIQVTLKEGFSCVEIKALVLNPLPSMNFAIEALQESWQQSLDKLENLLLITV